MLNRLRHLSRATWLKLILAVVAVVVGAVYLTWDILARGPIASLLTNRQELVELVASWGLLAPVLYILLQILQTVLAPIPGQVVGSIGGFLFGAWGILWTSIGTLIGCYIVFRIARRFGRPFLEKVFKKSAIDRFDFLLGSTGTSVALFLIFLLPGFPDDIVCYIAGLTPIPIPKLMLIVLLGRLPVIVVTNYIGAGLGTDFRLVAAASILSAIVLAIAVSQRERIIAFLKKGAKKPRRAKPKKPKNP